MAPDRLNLFCLIVNLCFASCLTATLNPRTIRPVSSNSQDPLKSSDVKATTSQTEIEQESTTGFKSQTTRYSAEVPSKLNYALKSELSTDSTVKDVRFRIPLNADLQSEKLGVTEDVGIIKKKELKPTSSAPVIFDPFHLIQAEQNMMKKLAQIPLVMNKDKNSKPEGTTRTQYFNSTVKVSDERVSEAPLGFLSLYDGEPKEKISPLEKLSSVVHKLGVFGNSSRIFPSSQTMLMQRSKPQVSEELKVDSATSKDPVSSVNLKPTKESKFMKLQESSKGLKDTPSEKLQVRSGIVDVSTFESLEVSRNPTQVPLSESTTNGVQLKLIPLENRNKDALISVGQRDAVTVSEALKSAPTPESVRTPTAAMDTGKADDVIDAGGLIPKGTMLSFFNSPSASEGASGSNQDVSVASIMTTPLPGNTYRDNNKVVIEEINFGTKPGSKRELEIKGVSISSSGGVTKSKVEDVTKSIPVVSVASLSSTSSPDMKYRDNVKVSELNSIAKYISKGKIGAIGDSVPDPEQITGAPTINNPLPTNTQLKGISNKSMEKNDARTATKDKLSAKGELESKNDGVQIFENKVDGIERNAKALPVGSQSSTHFPDIYYSSNGNIIDGKLNRELMKIVGEFNSKKLGETSDTKSDGVTRNILDVSTGIFVSTRQPDDKVVVGKTKEQVASKSVISFQSMSRISGSTNEGVAKEATAVSAEPLSSTPNPVSLYRRIDKAGLTMTADSKVSSKDEPKAGNSSGFLLEKTPDSKKGEADVLISS